MNSLYANNRNFFEKILPYGKELFEKLDRIAGVSYLIENPNDIHTLNVVREGKKVYSEGALEAARKEVLSFLKKPHRYEGLNPRNFLQDESIFGAFRENFLEGVKHLDTGPLKERDAGYCVIFGLGIGFHLNFLATNLDVDHFVFCETDLVQFKISCEVFPWEDFIVGLYAEKKKFTFYVSEEFESVGNAALNRLRDEGYANVDGSYFFQHAVDFDGSLRQARQVFDTTLSVLAFSMGYIEDEYIMLKNAVMNLSLYDFYLMPAHSKEQKDISALIVGSGPSVDSAIDVIKEQSNFGLVFSCGTSISILQKNNIPFDFHVVYENTSPSFEVINDIDDLDQLKEVYLVAPMSIDPRIAALFKGVIFYFRDTITPTILMASQDEIVYHSGSTVVNLACRASLSLGVKNLGLFGVDLGAKSLDQHHSQYSIYNIHKGREWISDGLDVLRVEKLTIPVEGTYGDTVLSDRVLLQSKVLLEGLINSHKETSVLNCSDGAKISGVQNLRPTDYKAEAVVENKREIFGDILEGWQFNEAGSAISVEHINNFKENVESILSDIEAFFVTLDKSASFKEILPYFEKEIFLSQVDNMHMETSARRAAQTYLSGTLQMIFQSGIFIYKRVSDEEQQEVLVQFRLNLLKTVQNMRLLTDKLVLTCYEAIEKGVSRP